MTSSNANAQKETTGSSFTENLSGDTLIVQSDTTIEFRHIQNVENLDNKYFAKLGIAFEPLTSHLNYKIELEDVYQVNFICCNLSDSSSTSMPEVRPEGLLSVEYKGQDITEMVKNSLRMNNDGFSLKREHENETLEQPIFIKVRPGYMIILRRVYALESGKLEN